MEALDILHLTVYAKTNRSKHGEYKKCAKRNIGYSTMDCI